MVRGAGRFQRQRRALESEQQQSEEDDEAEGANGVPDLLVAVVTRPAVGDPGGESRIPGERRVEVHAPVGEGYCLSGGDRVADVCAIELTVGVDERAPHRVVNVHQRGVNVVEMRDIAAPR